MPLVWPEDAGPREYIRADADEVAGAGVGVGVEKEVENEVGVEVGLGAAVFLEVYVKNAEEADFIEPPPPLQVV